MTTPQVPDGFPEQDPAGAAVDGDPDEAAQPWAPPTTRPMAPPQWQVPAGGPDQPPAAPPPPAGWTTGAAGPGWTSGAAGPGWTSGSGAAGGPPPAAAGQQPLPGWGSPAGWASTRPAAAQPGVVPLRPLSLSEILDGAITTMRKHPGAMLGLSAVVAVVSQTLQLAATWVFIGDLATLEETAASEPTVDQVTQLVAGSAGGLLLSLVVSFLATTILTGILTVVVSRAVLGRSVSAGEAWAMARPRLWRLIGLTLLVGLLTALPILAATVLVVGLGLTGSSGAAVGVGVVAFIAAVPAAVYLYVRLALAGPALMLETMPDGRPTGVSEALRRSGRLVRGSWWRVFGILVLASLIAFTISSVFSLPAALLGALFTAGLGDGDEATFLGLVASGLAGSIAATITTPFVAGVSVLLYVDRRIRREGLDIELAQAAGVTIPGRTDSPGPT